VGDLTPPETVMRDDGVRLAVRRVAGAGPAIMFLPGHLSDMTGGKAVAIANWAERTGRACVRFDYSGCGESEGDALAATLDTWRDDALLVLERMTQGPVVLVGSSMGGWLMLLLAERRPDRIAGLIGIAPAPDFTDWGYSEDQKLAMLREGQICIPSEYGYDPIVITRAFWQSGEANRLLQRSIAVDCPVRLLHGQRDPDVPWHHSLHLADKLRSADVQVTLVKDGDHRLSRDADIALLIATLERLLESL
jgi:pimeloyl-ACP methyl ester carboxylesterase